MRPTRHANDQLSGRRGLKAGLLPAWGVAADLPRFPFATLRVSSRVADTHVGWLHDTELETQEAIDPFKQ